MQKDKIKKLFSIAGICTTFFILQTSPIQEFTSLPKEIRLFMGSEKEIVPSLPAVSLVPDSQSNIVSINGSKITPNETGETKLQLKLGSIPIKTVHVQVLPDIRLYPGGQSIGVKLQSAGIMVVGLKQVANGQSPAAKAKIQVGDLITKINGKIIENASDLGKLVNQEANQGKPLTVEILRGDEKLNVTVTPVKDEDNQYKLGLYVRDSAAGVGTMTFYDPKTNKYGALGHVISDLDTQKPIVVGKGNIVPSKVTSIDRGKEGKPGSIRAIFPDDNATLGNIEKNTPFGIFGTLDKQMVHPIYKEPLPVALIEEIKEGPAEILTVVEGNKIEKFSIEIVNVVKQRYPSTKGMIIKITDKRLLEKTGGIVQGMSGSPIIKDGKLIGAVTHVFLEDSAKGYAVFIEWMLREAGIDIYGETSNVKDYAA